MAERRHIEHAQVLRLAKVVLLLVERQHMLLEFPGVTNLDRTIIPPEDLLKAS
ncbi:MAG TPA: hypothetical protein VFE27_04695 [Acidobacteriaceae bacterium]|nr:hypothetical protein [Acidobacteriaceae bacterium]